FYKKEQSKRQIDPAIRELIDGDAVQMLVYGEDIQCKLVVIHHCMSLEVMQQHIPKLESLTSLIIVDETVLKQYNREREFTLRQLRNNHMAYFNTVGNWFYYNEADRKKINEQFRREIKYIPFR